MGGIIAFEVAHENPQSMSEVLQLLIQDLKLRQNDYMSRFLLWQRELFMYSTKYGSHFQNLSQKTYFLMRSSGRS